MNFGRLLEQLARHPVELGVLMAAALAFALVAVAVLKVRPGFPLLLLICLFIMLAGSSSQYSLQFWSKSYLRWLALAAVLLSAPLYLRTLRQPQNRPTVIHACFALLLLFALITAPLGRFPRFSLLSVLAVSIVYGGAFGAAWLYTSDPRRLMWLIDVLHRLAGIVVVLGFAFLVAPGVTHFVQGRFQGFFNNPNWNGNFSSMLLPVVLWKWRYPRSRRERQATSVLLVLMGCNILLSGSRGAILGGFLASGLAMWRLDPARLRRYAVILGLFAFVVIVGQVGREQLENRLSSLARLERVSTLTHRTEMWSEAWPTIRKNWLMGLGLGNSRFILLSAEEAEEKADYVGAYAGHLHSQHILMAAELGVIGLGFFWAFMLYVIAEGLQIARWPRAPLSDLAFALFCSCLFVFADAFLHGWLLSAGSPFALLFWIMVSVWLKSMRFAVLQRQHLAANTERHAHRNQYALSHPG